ncbi:hypothetical protein ABZW11_22010 [Nonomuraea sp. NPDC004580]|uniref:hypothetical protein n=1 Tax=Nonomuraea sp. NPDC004580 TaxID=3154552 RepID=UPI0033A02FD7
MLFQEINELITYDDRQRMIPTDYTTLRALGVGLLVLGEHAAAIDHLTRALAEADTTRGVRDQVTGSCGGLGVIRHACLPRSALHRSLTFGRSTTLDITPNQALALNR